LIHLFIALSPHLISAQNAQISFLPEKVGIMLSKIASPPGPETETVIRQQ
jgi:hypothetical protein